MFKVLSIIFISGKLSKEKYKIHDSEHPMIAKNFIMLSF